MKSEEILPCPFCGKPAVLHKFTEGENEGGECVSCIGCLASGPVRFGIKDSTDVVDHWNHRVPATRERLLESGQR